MKTLMTIIMLLALSTVAIAGINSGSYDLCLMTLNMDKIVCTQDIGESFMVTGNQWSIGDFKGRIENGNSFAKLFLTKDCQYSPCAGSTFIGYYSYVGDGWTADMQTRIILVQDPIDYDSWCVGFSPMPSWCN